jgi:hypothetical protein
MRPSGKLIAAAAIIMAGVAAFAPAPDASNAHFAIVNNSDFYYPSYGYNFGTVLKLAGPKDNPSLNLAASLATGTMGQDINQGTPMVQVVRHNSDICIFLADGVDSSGANQISSFKYPNQTPVGTYTDSNVPSSALPSWIAASGGYLFEGLVSSVADVASWSLGSGCTLTLAQTTSVKVGESDVVVTPNGKAIIASGAVNADSYTIGPNGSLTENGPYVETGGQDGMDITADSEYVLFGSSGCLRSLECYSAIDVVGINADGSLNPGSEKIFGGDGTLGRSQRAFYLHLSPDERFLYSTGWTEDGKIQQEITFAFTESPLDVTYHAGCTTNLRASIGFAYSLATAGTSGAGGALYIAESGEEGPGGVALLHINSTTGCTTEAPESPYSIADPHAAIESVVAWPPRPF